MDAKDLILGRVLRELEGKRVIALGRGLPQLIRPHLPEGTQTVSVAEDARGLETSAEVAVVDASEVSAAGDVVGVEPLPPEVEDAPRWIVATFHTREDGAPKLVRECHGDRGSVSPRRTRLIITELGVVEVDSVGLVLKEIAPGVASDEVKMKTGASLHVADDLRTMEF